MGTKLRASGRRCQPCTAGCRAVLGVFEEHVAMGDDKPSHSMLAQFFLLCLGLLEPFCLISRPVQLLQCLSNTSAAGAPGRPALRCYGIQSCALRPVEVQHSTDHGCGHLTPAHQAARRRDRPGGKTARCRGCHRRDWIRQNHSVVSGKRASHDVPAVIAFKCGSAAAVQLAVRQACGVGAVCALLHQWWDARIAPPAWISEPYASSPCRFFLRRGWRMEAS